MRITRRKLAAIIGSATLGGMLCLSATASAAITSHAGAATPDLDQRFIICSDQGPCINAPGAGDVHLGGYDVFENISEFRTGGHIYYEYQDVTETGLCLQASTNDTMMTAGGCAEVNRQYWFWNGVETVDDGFSSMTGFTGHAPDRAGCQSGAFAETPRAIAWDVSAETSGHAAKRRRVRDAGPALAYAVARSTWPDLCSARCRSGRPIRSGKEACDVHRSSGAVEGPAWLTLGRASASQMKANDP